MAPVVAIVLMVAFRDPRVKASEKQIAQSLEGHWQEDLLFVLKQNRMATSFASSRWRSAIADLSSTSSNKRIAAKVPICRKRSARSGSRRKRGISHLRTGLFRITGVDLTQIDCIDVMTTTTTLSEAGSDMSKWETEHHFVSWLRLCPDNRISGDKIIGKARLPSNNRITNALKMAASTLRTSNKAQA